MKKILFALFLLPLFTNAQNTLPVKNDFRENVKDLAKPYVWDEKLNILPVNLENSTSEIIALDQNMNTVWSTTIRGYVLECGKFKDQVLAVGASENSMYRGLKGEFVAYLLDSKTGKINIQKTLATPPAQNYLQFTMLFNKTGNTFGLALRETAMSTSLIKMLPDGKKYFKTSNLTVISYNEKLEPQFQLKPGISNQIVLSVDANEWGDIFLSILKNNRTVEVTKYAAGSSIVSGILSQDIEFHKNIDTEDASLHFDFLPSKQNRNVIYFALLHDNVQKVVQLSTVKLDFEHKANLVTKEIFTKDRIKLIEKAFVPKKGLDNPDLGGASALEVRHMEEYNGNVFVVMSGRFMRQGSQGWWSIEMSPLINVYDGNLKLKFQHAVPAGYSSPLGYLSTGFHADSGNLYVLLNNKDGMTKLNTIYGKLDLSTGQWLKLEKLSKDKVKGTTIFDGTSTLWFKDGFILPYLRKAGLFSLKYDISLQSNAY